MSATGEEAITIDQLSVFLGKGKKGSGQAVSVAQAAAAFGYDPGGASASGGIPVLDVGDCAITLKQLENAFVKKSVTLKNLLSNNGYGYPASTTEGFATNNWARTPLPPGDSVQRCLWLVPSANRVESFRTINSVGAGLVPNHTYYFTFKVYYPTNTVVGSFDFYWPVAEPPGMSGAKATQPKTWTKLSAVFDRKAHSGSSGSRQARWDYNCNNQTVGVNVTSFMLIDLTQAFGSGKEPSRMWCDANIPWFDSTLTMQAIVRK